MDCSQQKFFSERIENEIKQGNHDGVKDMIGVIYNLGYQDCMDIFFDGSESIYVGEKILETLAESMKAEFLGEKFDKYTEAELRKILTR